MTIEFPCRCGHVFQVEEDQAGLDVQCPSCGLLNAVPTHDDLNALGEDGTYKVESGPEIANHDLAAELAYIYHRDPLDIEGNEKNLKLTRADIEAIDGETIPLAPQIPTLEHAPRYDPETGELITPLEVKPDERIDINPGAIPMARATINYASAQTARRSSFAHAFVHLFAPGNLAVMLAVLCMHVILFPVIFVAFMGIFLLSFFLLAFIAGLFAHYGNVIEDVGPFEKDELPRPFRDLSLYEDIWHPFCSVMASLVICYLPGIIFSISAAAHGHPTLAMASNLIWQAL
ncbi:MAG TPA: hypothetical protein VN541_09585, partial [Tepidisphaeraceae bacterium]|nr:hypothetical protein [Tepidisphaeraceae bacterium]